MTEESFLNVKSKKNPWLPLVAKSAILAESPVPWFDREVKQHGHPANVYWIMLSCITFAIAIIAPVIYWKIATTSSTQFQTDAALAGILISFVFLLFLYVSLKHIKKSTSIKFVRNDMTANRCELCIKTGWHNPQRIRASNILRVEYARLVEPNRSGTPIYGITILLTRRGRQLRYLVAALDSSELAEFETEKLCEILGIDENTKTCNKELPVLFIIE